MGAEWGAVLLGFMGSSVAAATDLATRRIPNLLVYPMLASVPLFIAWRWLEAGGGGEIILDGIGGLIIIGGAWLLVYILGGCGGGDVKLLAANGGLLGLWLGAQYAVYALVVAVFYLAILFIAKLAWRLFPGAEWLENLVRRHSVTSDRGPLGRRACRPQIKLAIPFAVPAALGFVPLAVALYLGFQW